LDGGGGGAIEMLPLAPAIFPSEIENAAPTAVFALKCRSFILSAFS
jgi:hypothetical protein